MYCDIKTLFNCVLVNKCAYQVLKSLNHSLTHLFIYSYQNAMEVAAIIVAAIERKYFSVSYFNHPYLQLNSMMKLVKLYAHSTSKINSVVIIRGFITYQGSSLDKETIKWKRCNDCRRDRSHFASVLYHGEVYVISTISNIAAGTVEKFNPYLDQWHLVSSLPRPLHSVGAVVLHDKLYVLGGYDNSNNISDRVYEYVNDTKVKKLNFKNTIIHFISLTNARRKENGLNAPN